MSFYKTKTWYRLRWHQLEKEPLCRMCKALGRIVGAEIVDHIVPHRGNQEIFEDPENLQSLCKACHDRHKQRQEKSGVLVGHSADGMPVDPNHHWNRRK